jgi:DNA mismatch endonuclease (patch repair protein)
MDASERMKRVRQQDTGPELAVRRLLWKRGWRYRLHDPSLPGCPDIVFHNRRKVIFVNGCFWHGHKNCRRAKLPKSRQEYWTNRILVNRSRDMRVSRKLRSDGWRVLIIWECELKDASRLEKRLCSFLSNI